MAEIKGHTATSGQCTPRRSIDKIGQQGLTIEDLDDEADQAKARNEAERCPDSEGNGNNITGVQTRIIAKWKEQNQTGEKSEGEADQINKNEVKKASPVVGIPEVKPLKEECKVEAVAEAIKDQQCSQVQQQAKPSEVIKGTIDPKDLVPVLGVDGKQVVIGKGAYGEVTLCKLEGKLVVEKRIYPCKGKNELMLPTVLLCSCLIGPWTCWRFGEHDLARVA